jgi:hypothetical protein
VLVVMVGQLWEVVPSQKGRCVSQRACDITVTVVGANEVNRAGQRGVAKIHPSLFTISRFTGI